jgi:hypothetical protein
MHENSASAVMSVFVTDEIAKGGGGRCVRGFTWVSHNEQKRLVVLQELLTKMKTR